MSTLTSLKAQTAFIFKKNFILGAVILTLGLKLSVQNQFSWPTILLYAILGGWVIGYSFKLLVQNTIFSSLRFYEHMLKIQIESCRLFYWKPLLMKRFFLSALCTALIISTVLLPMVIQLLNQRFSMLYFAIVLFFYARIGKFMVIQLREGKAIKRRASEIEAFFTERS